ncbi:hypothetical protein IBE48_07660 [Francisella philomiragia]|uniref:Uncharacterized protein n=2 Tax=Francisella philomiragia TaxID=28110 RepID=A0AAW3D981_9GAMM|nr:hypothetical protein [Francisella philomiragia]KFJ42155.1 hypothetical protein DR78_612 [Francisella philomiragia]MBK2273626.1 hypothetical protein [Francisella philomiragia]MBK2277507.1 hypothetical protein [Francisella philomiragia]MBK2281497.1 hypothetical protein [Francisella philomiragia]MBK2283261.1 hypothetical protein [Francisella philomiragia]
MHEKNILLPSFHLMRHTGVVYFELMEYSDDPEYVRNQGWNNEQFAQYYGFDSVFTK